MNTIAATLLSLTIATSSPLLACKACSERFRCDAQSWAGEWQTNWGVMVLKFDDDQFTGSYSSSGHAVSGKFDPANPCVLSGTWRHANLSSTGRFTFRMAGAKGFAGKWSWGDKDPQKASGVWTGKRVPEMVHTGCDREPEPKPRTLTASIESTVIASGNWLIQDVVLRNDTGRDFYIYGYSKDDPFIGVQLKDLETGKWVGKGLGYCGTGAGFHRVASGERFKCSVGLQREDAGKEFAVTLGTYREKTHEGVVEMRTRPLRVKLPVKS